MWWTGRCAYEAEENGRDNTADDVKEGIFGGMKQAVLYSNAVMRSCSGIELSTDKRFITMIGDPFYHVIEELCC